MKQSMRARTRFKWPLAGAAAVVGSVAVVQFALPPHTPAFAQEQSVTAGLNAPSFADVVERASAAVVNISVTKVVNPVPTMGPREEWSRRAPNGSLEEFFGRFFDMPGMPAIPGMPRGPQRSEGAGSGFVVDPDGHIVTNYHVVSDAEEIVVTFQDGTRLDARVVGEDPQTDLAVLEVDADHELPYVEFGNSDAVRVGEWVLVISNLFGLGGSATAGIVSARGRDIRSGPYDDYLQIDAPINRGNSGGPVFNANGEVIGVSTAIFSPNGGNIGIGFAIPSNQAASVVSQLKASGSVERGWLGVQIQPLDEDLAESLGLDRADGALIAEVVADSPAARAGLESGDVVTRFGDRDIGSPRELSFAVAAHAPGERVEIEVVRDGETRTFAVELGEPAGARRAAATGRGGAADRDGTLGLRLAPLTERDRTRLGLAADEGGAVIVDIRPDSPAARKGLRPGDVIVGVNRRDVDSVDDVVAALQAARKDGGSALLLVRAADGQRFVAIDLS